MTIKGYNNRDTSECGAISPPTVTFQPLTTFHIHDELCSVRETFDEACLMDKPPRGRPNLVVICGSARSGKNTVTDFLASALTLTNIPVSVQPLGLMVKQELEKFTGISVANQERDRERWRVPWQVWGTEVRRCLFGENYWIRQWCKIANPRHHLIVPDCRFENEIIAFRAFAERHNMALREVCVKRSPLWELQQLAKPHSWHVSEREWRKLAAKFQYQIRNRTVAQLHAKCYALAEEWLVS